MKPAAVYIDGFNLYFGLSETNMRRWLWVDLWALAERIVPEGHYAAEVRYYTARVTRPNGSRERQNQFLTANALHRPELVIVEGFMQFHDRTCLQCSHVGAQREEKQTDVNIALDMALTAMSPATAHEAVVLLSADSDQVPTVARVQACGLPVHVRFPPGRNCNELRKMVPDAYQISKEKVKRSQLPETVMDDRGRRYERPKVWIDGSTASEPEGVF